MLHCVTLKVCVELHQEGKYQSVFKQPTGLLRAKEESGDSAVD